MGVAVPPGEVKVSFVEGLHEPQVAGSEEANTWRRKRTNMAAGASQAEPFGLGRGTREEGGGGWRRDRSRWLGTQPEVTFDSGRKIMHKRFPFYFVVD